MDCWQGHAAGDCIGFTDTERSSGRDGILGLKVFLFFFFSLGVMTGLRFFVLVLTLPLRSYWLLLEDKNAMFCHLFVIEVHMNFSHDFFFFCPLL